MIYVLSFVALAAIAWWLPGARDRWRQMVRDDRAREELIEMHDRMERKDTEQ